LSAIVVVWVTDFAVRQATGAAPSDYRMVKLISYTAIAAIGGWMLWKALRSGRHRHDHPDDSHGHHHRDGCSACAALQKERKGTSGWLALAVGSVPCTGALLVLLFGMANDLLVPAILMVVAISVGMAVAMSGIGVLAILSRQLVDRRLEGNEEKHHRFASGARIAGAAVVLLIGVGLFGLTLSNEAGRIPQEAKTAQRSEAK
jgi:ABC-type nickel/cobalt efflux system permease component RcnA